MVCITIQGKFFKNYLKRNLNKTNFTIGENDFSAALAVTFFQITSK
jgi:hypothetical protein